MSDRPHATEATSVPSSSMVQSSSLDRLPPELRVSIYESVFGSSKTIKPKDSSASLGIDKAELSPAALSANPDIPLETSILATNKTIFREAVQVLYHNRTVRATLYELKRLYSCEVFAATVEHVEVAGHPNSEREYVYREYDSGLSWLTELLRLPRIRSVTILSDCLGATPVPVSSNKLTDLGPATCIDIGRYKLHGQYSGIQIANRRLTKMWPSVQNATPAEYKAWDDLSSMMERWDPPTDMRNRLALTSHTSFRCWVGLHDKVASVIESGMFHELRERERAGTLLDDTDEWMAFNFAENWPKITVNSPFRDNPYNTSRWYEKLPRTKSLQLRHLKLGDDPEVLSWASEYLASNIALFRSVDGPFPGVLASNGTPHWAEADGGQHTIVVMIQEQKLAFAGLPSSSYILEPVRRDTLLEHSLICSRIRTSHLHRLAYPTPLGAMAPPEFKQLANLSIALWPDYETLGRTSGPRYRYEHDVWAYDLLKRYLLVSKQMNSSVIREMNLEDMRTSMTKMLQRPVQNWKALRSNPPQDLDADLFLPLAWKWSLEYASICLEQHEARYGKFDCSDWLEEDAEMASDSDWDDEE